MAVMHVDSENFHLQIRCAENNDSFSFDSLSKAEVFKRYQSAFAENLVLKFPKPPSNSGIQSVNSYCKVYDLKEKFCVTKVQLDKVFKILKIF